MAHGESLFSLNNPRRTSVPRHGRATGVTRPAYQIWPSVYETTKPALAAYVRDAGCHGAIGESQAGRDAAAGRVGSEKWRRARAHGSCFCVTCWETTLELSDRASSPTNEPLSIVCRRSARVFAVVAAPLRVGDRETIPCQISQTSETGANHSKCQLMPDDIVVAVKLLPLVLQPAV